MSLPVVRAPLSLLRLSAAPRGLRTGLFMGRLPTPGFLLYTRRGTSPLLTHDLLATLPAVHAMTLPLPDIFVEPGADTIRAFAGACAAVKSPASAHSADSASKVPSASSSSPAPAAPVTSAASAASALRPLARFLHLEGYLSLVTQRDVLQGGLASANDKSFGLASFQGMLQATPDAFMDTQLAYGCDVFAACSDEVAGHVSYNRARKSVDRTIAWLDKCLERVAKAQAEPQGEAEAQTPAVAPSGGAGAAGPRSPPLAAAAAAGGGGGGGGVAVPFIFGVVQGANHAALRERCARAVAARPVHGFALAGLDADPQKRTEILRVVTKCLPPSLPRLLPGVGAPDEVLQGVQHGVDLFEAAYPLMATEMACALSFPIPRRDYTQRDREAPSKLNLRDVSFRSDKRALIPGCGCYTCLNHTRAYIHHLFNTHEMLSDVLLQVHNVYHYSAFFDALRESIAADEFEAFVSRFLREFQRK